MCRRILSPAVNYEHCQVRQRCKSMDRSTSFARTSIRGVEMTSESIRAYDLPKRVASYDSDMDIMHPNRHKMADIIESVLSVGDASPRQVIDIGTGTGFLVDRLLRAFPDLCVIAIDGAQQMVDLARTRLGPLAQRVDFRIGDFRSLDVLCAGVGAVDAVVSAYALHHLSSNEKSEVLRAAHGHIKPGGWFLNADLTLMENDELEKFAQRMRVDGIVRRASGRDARFADAKSTRQFLDDLERNEGDQPLRPAEDLRLLYEAGFAHVTTFWRETREVVYGGVR
jgi:tRNA (cmo5U34)-methyltransferase